MLYDPNVPFLHLFILLIYFKSRSPIQEQFFPSGLPTNMHCWQMHSRWVPLLQKTIQLITNSLQKLWQLLQPAQKSGGEYGIHETTKPAFMPFDVIL